MCLLRLVVAIRYAKFMRYLYVCSFLQIFVPCLLQFSIEQSSIHSTLGDDALMLRYF